MKSLEELKAIRERMQATMSARDAVDENDTRVVVGMATCGIAAGARETLNAFNEEIAKRKFTNVKVVQTGCIGMCRLEPIVEVIRPDGGKVTYVHMTHEKVARVVADHLVNGNVVTDYVITNEQ